MPKYREGSGIIPGNTVECICFEKHAGPHLAEIPKGCLAWEKDFSYKDNQHCIYWEAKMKPPILG